MRMETIQLTLDASLLSEIDQATRALDMTRPAFMRAALEWALRNQQLIALEQQHAQGYLRLPLAADEVREWETEQVWEDT
ncbi:MAG: CopG family transcriptional regulator [Chloroflexi bacterium]|nr:MAG: CopG family transcriptional regulator [Chloroflexota bacterium]